MKIFKSLITIVAAVAIAVGATGAYFSDSEVVAGNTFTAGEVDIDIRGACSGPQTFSNMAPGIWTDPCEYKIYNKSTSLPVKYIFDASKVSQTESGMYGLIGVKVWHGHYVTGTSPANFSVVYEGHLKDMHINSIDHAISDTLDTNITHVYYLQYRLDPSAGNQYENDSVVFDLNFNATQVNNPSW